MRRNIKELLEYWTPHKITTTATYEDITHRITERRWKGCTSWEIRRIVEEPSFIERLISLFLIFYAYFVDWLHRSISRRG